jgi:integrase
MLDAFSEEEIYVPTLLAVFTGLRRGEVLGLRWEDVDLEHGLLNIRQALHVEDREIKAGLPKSEASESQVAIPSSLIGELKRHHTAQKKQRLLSGQNYVDSGLVCTRLDGSPWNPSTFSSIFRRYLKYHGLSHIRFHDLRHYENQKIMGNAC